MGLDNSCRAIAVNVNDSPPNSPNSRAEIDTENVSPVISEKALAMASWICVVEIDLIEELMKLTLEKTKALTGRFAVVFPPPTNARFDDLADVWHKALAEIEEDDATEACKKLMQRLTRFPFPADIVALVRSAHETPNVSDNRTTEAAHEAKTE